MKHLVSARHEEFLRLLKYLVSLNTVYSNTKGIQSALRFCKDHFERHLNRFDLFYDAQSNLICISKQINAKKNIVYLSAHIDTVPADKSEWDPRFNPFVPFEDDVSIVGRGASDDKAGVAYQLYLAYLIGKQKLHADNVVFTISSREEQNGQSAKEIGCQLGKRLPVGPKTYLITLENNVHVGNPPTLCINYGERGAIGIEVTGMLEDIQTFLRKDSYPWNPTVIAPIEEKQRKWRVFEQPGGHAATVPREHNRLFQLLSDHDMKRSILCAGSRTSMSAVPKTIQYAKSTMPVAHQAIFDLRTMERMDAIAKDLAQQNIRYRVIKQLDHGYDIQDQLQKDRIYRIAQRVAHDLLLSFEINPGSTDSGTIYASCSEEIRRIFLPITMGPGSRSQRQAVPPRLTHGANETYDKKSGLAAISFITQVLAEMGFISAI